MRRKKDLNTDVDLISFIALLAILICSLLLTVVWVQIGSINVKQAVGGSSGGGSAKTPALWVFVDRKGGVRFRAENVRLQSNLKRHRVPGKEGKVHSDKIKKYLKRLKRKAPQIKTVLIQPRAKTVYEEVIRLMDDLKEVGYESLGISPI